MCDVYNNDTAIYTVKIQCCVWGNAHSVSRSSEKVSWTQLYVSTCVTSLTSITRPIMFPMTDLQEKLQYAKKLLFLVSICYIKHPLICLLTLCKVIETII